jgi:hypothetical protein
VSFRCCFGPIWRFLPAGAPRGTRYHTELTFLLALLIAILAHGWGRMGAHRGRGRLRALSPRLLSGSFEDLLLARFSARKPHLINKGSLLAGAGAHFKPAEDDLFPSGLRALERAQLGVSFS